MKLRVIVVDDEPLARRRLIALVDRAGGAEVVGEAGDADAAIALVRASDPDVALLDIRLPGRDGLELARALEPRPAVVFTTAFAEHAVDAFDASAVDYLLKPIAADKLARALARAAARVTSNETTRGGAPRIAARSGDVVRLFWASQIARFRADHKYTVFTADDQEHLIDESLAELEQRLAAFGFARAHRAELVQLARVRAVHRHGDSAQLELDDGQLVPVSRRLLPGLLDRLGAR